MTKRSRAPARLATDSKTFEDTSNSPDGVKVTCNTHTWPPDRKTRREQLRTRLQIKRDGQTGIQETRWEFRTYNARQVKALLRKVPDFTCVACHDFHYDAEDLRKLDDSYADIVLVLRRN